MSAPATRFDEGTLAALRDALGPGGVVESSALERTAYARDLWPLGHLAFHSSGFDLPEPFRLPDAVARPRTVEGVARVLRLANEKGFAVVPWGAGSGVCGGTVAVRGGVALDLKGLDRIRSIDARALLVDVEAGVNGQHLEDALEKQGLTLGHFPSSIYCSTVGGWLAARGAGQLSTKYGKIEDRVISVEVVLPTGDVVRTVTSPKAAMGPDWNQLFVGSEGTLGVIASAVLGARLAPETRRFRAFEFKSAKPALEAIRTTLRRGGRPAAVRLYDELDTFLVGSEGDAHEAKHEAKRDAKTDEPAGGIAPWWPLSRVSLSGLSDLLEKIPHTAAKLGKRALLARPEMANRIARSIPNARCLLILTFEGDPVLTEAEERVGVECCLREGGKDVGPGPAERWWRNRYAVSFKQSAVYLDGGFVDTMEVATTWDKLWDLYTGMREALSPHALVLAHFSHAYPEGCSIYFTCAARIEKPEETRAVYKRIWDAGMKAAVERGAAISHHHGIGLLKAPALRASYGPALMTAFERVKHALDPNNVLNPGKLGLP